VNEAMSYGVPFIVSGCIGARELVKDSEFIIEHLNKDRLKQVILQAYYLSDQDYCILRRKAFEYAKKLYYRKICRMLIKNH